jgi:zinc/manganese transport system permease protein
MFSELIREHFVHTALAAGAAVAVVAGVVGTFVVLRGMSFAVHALSELGFTGAAGALLLGLDPLAGLLGGSVAVALVLGLLTVRGRERDAAIGSFLAFGLGVGVLLLSLYRGYATAATGILFGSIVGVSDVQLWILLGCATACLAGLGVVYRPLLFASVDPDVAESRGVPVRLLSVVFLLILGVASAIAVETVGALLILTLLVTPAATAQLLTARPARVAALSVGVSVTAAVGGILCSLQWPHPVSFFVSAISFAAYLAARAAGWSRGRSRT